MLKKVVSSGKVKSARFLIFPQDSGYNARHGIEFNATVTTPTETHETKCNCWQAAHDWVDNTITKIEEKSDEIDRDY